MCRAIVPIYREHVFAEFKPSTQMRVDLYLALKGCKRKLPKRVVATGGLDKGDRITHRIPTADVSELGEFVETWLQVAYDLGA